MKNLIERTKCRICSSPILKFLNLGVQPLPNAFKSPGEYEYKFPLEVAYCPRCHLVQLIQVVSPKLLFSEYSFITSSSPGQKEHLRHLAININEEFNIENDLIIDIGGNDGTLSKYFNDLGNYSINVDPAGNLAKYSRRKGVRTIISLMNTEVANYILGEFGEAKAITSTNSFAHIDDLPGLTRNIKQLLKEEGVFILEVPHLLSLMKSNQFDTIYFEHLSYFSLKSLIYLFKEAGLDLFRVEKIPIHGGSIRAYIKKNRKPEDSVQTLLEEEEKYGLYKYDTYLEFEGKIRSIKEEFVEFLMELKKEDKLVCGYGAAAKGTVLLNYCGIDLSLIKCIYDNSPTKIGKLVPGVHIPVVSEELLYRDHPNYLVLLPWNWFDIIYLKEKKFVDYGGRWILVIPKLKIIPEVGVKWRI